MRRSQSPSGTASPLHGEISPAEIAEVLSVKLRQVRSRRSRATADQISVVHCKKIARRLEEIRKWRLRLPQSLYFPILEKNELVPPSSELKSAGVRFLTQIDARLALLREERNAVAGLRRQDPNLFSSLIFENQNEMEALDSIARHIRRHSRHWQPQKPTKKEIIEWHQIADLLAGWVRELWRDAGISARSLDSSGPTIAVVQWALQRSYGHSAGEKSIQTAIETLQRGRTKSKI